MHESEWQQLPVPLWMRDGSWGHSRLRSRSSSPLPQAPPPRAPLTTQAPLPLREQMRQKHSDGSWGHSRHRSQSSSPLPQVPQVPQTTLAPPPQEQLRQQHLGGSWGRMEHRSRSCVQREAVPLPQE